MITKEFIDKLAVRYAAITKKGEWMSLERGHPDKRGWRLFVSYASPHMGGSPVPVCELSNCNARGTGYEEAALIAALYNAWPTIEKALRKHMREEARKRTHSRPRAHRKATASLTWLNDPSPRRKLQISDKTESTRGTTGSPRVDPRPTIRGFHAGPFGLLNLDDIPPSGPKKNVR